MIIALIAFVGIFTLVFATVSIVNIFSGSNNQIESEGKNATSQKGDIYNLHLEFYIPNDDSFVTINSCPTDETANSGKCKKKISKNYTLSKLYTNKMVENYCTKKGYTNYENYSFTFFPFKTKFKCYKYEYSNPKKMTIPNYKMTDYKDILSACGGGDLSTKGRIPTVGAMLFSAMADYFNNNIRPNILSAGKSISKLKTLGPKATNTIAQEYRKKAKCNSYTKDCIYENYKICDSSKSYNTEFLNAYFNEISKDFKKSPFSSAWVTDEKKLNGYLITGKCMAVAVIKPNCKYKFCSSDYNNIIGVYSGFWQNEGLIVDPLHELFARSASLKALLDTTVDGGVKVFCARDTTG